MNWASPVRGKSGDRPLTEIPFALTDMLASALRGTTKASLGFPGDIETLGRMGINYGSKKLGYSGVDPKPVIPNTEDFGRWLPGGTNQPTAETLGEFLPAPTAMGLGYRGAKQLSQTVSKLRGAPEVATDLGRRGALQKIGAVGATALAAPHLLTKVMTEAAPAAKVAAEGKGVAAAVKAAAHAWNPAEIIASTPRIRELYSIGLDEVNHIGPETLELAAKHYSNPKELANADAWAQHWHGGMANSVKEPFKPGFDALKADDAWQADLDKLRKLELGDGSKYLEEYKALKLKHYPDSARSEEWLKFRDLEDYLRQVPNSEIDEIIKKYKSGQVPPEWAAKGITPEMVIDRALTQSNHAADAGDRVTRFSKFIGSMEDDATKAHQEFIEDMYGKNNPFNPFK